MKRTLTLLFIVLLLAAVGGGAYLLFRDTTPPAIALDPPQGPVSHTTEFRLALADDVSGVKAYSVVATQDNTVLTIQDQTLSHMPADLVQSFSLPAGGLKDGPFQIVVTAVDNSFSGFGSGAKSTRSWNFELDSRPPMVGVVSTQHNIRQGGAGFVIYEISEEPASTGVQVGDWFFPGHRMADGRFGSLFAWPYNMSKDEFSPRVTAADPAGNVRTVGFSFFPKTRDFKSDIIRIPDSFLQRKMPEFQSAFPEETDPLQLFLRVNRDMRKANRQALRQIGRDTADHFIFEGAFARMKNAAPMSGFADHRTYTHESEVIDEQYHLGIDLASVKNDEVPAANHGRVVFAGEFGIYGGCVIIDHGMGLQTLYAHLSRIDVTSGQDVSKWDVIGLTGATGMAGGDHLHYAVVISGLPVHPVEWFDGRWIRHNVTDRM